MRIPNPQSCRSAKLTATMRVLLQRGRVLETERRPRLLSLHLVVQNMPTSQHYQLFLFPVASELLLAAQALVNYHLSPSESADYRLEAPVVHQVAGPAIKL